VLPFASWNLSKATEKDGVQQYSEIYLSTLTILSEVSKIMRLDRLLFN